MNHLNRILPLFGALLVVPAIASLSTEAATYYGNQIVIGHLINTGTGGTIADVNSIEKFCVERDTKKNRAALYIYCDEGNPGEVYSRIEMPYKVHNILVMKDVGVEFWNKQATGTLRNIQIRGNVFAHMGKGWSTKWHTPNLTNNKKNEREGN